MRKQKSNQAPKGPIPETVWVEAKGPIPETVWVEDVLNDASLLEMSSHTPVRPDPSQGLPDRPFFLYEVEEYTTVLVHFGNKDWRPCRIVTPNVLHLDLEIVYQGSPDEAIEEAIQAIRSKCGGSYRYNLVAVKVRG